MTPSDNSFTISPHNLALLHSTLLHSYPVPLNGVHLGNLHIALWFDQNLKAVSKNKKKLWHIEHCFCSKITSNKIVHYSAFFIVGTVHTSDCELNMRKPSRFSPWKPVFEFHHRQALQQGDQSNIGIAALHPVYRRERKMCTVSVALKCIHQLG